MIHDNTLCRASGIFSRLKQEFIHVNCWCLLSASGTTVRASPHLSCRNSPKPRELETSIAALKRRECRTSETDRFDCTAGAARLRGHTWPRRIDTIIIFMQYSWWVSPRRGARVSSAWCKYFSATSLCVVCSLTSFGDDRRQFTIK